MRIIHTLNGVHIKYKIHVEEPVPEGLTFQVRTEGKTGKTYYPVLVDKDDKVVASVRNSSKYGNRGFKVAASKQFAAQPGVVYAPWAHLDAFFQTEDEAIRFMKAAGPLFLAPAP